MLKLLSAAVIVSAALTGLTTIQVASAATVDQVKINIFSALNIPLPLTVIGPLVSQDVVVEGSGDNFSAVLKGTSLMGFVPLGDIPFTVTVQDDEHYRITGLQLPKSISVGPIGELTIANTVFDGVWNTKERSYQELSFGIEGLEFSQPQNTEAKLSLGELNLTVAKEGSGNNKISDFRLAAKDIVAVGMWLIYMHDSDASTQQLDLYVDDLSIQLAADAEQPVDIYGLISKIIISSVMQPDAGKTMQIFQGLTGETYDKLQLVVDGKGLKLKEYLIGNNVADVADGYEGLINIETINGLLDFTNIDPENWQQAKLVFTGSDIDVEEYANLESFAMESGEIAISLADVPIGKFATAVNLVKQLADGSAYSLNSGPIAAGLLDVGKLQASTNITGLSIVPAYVADPGVSFDQFNYQMALSDFQPGQAESIAVEANVENLSVDINDQELSDIEQERVTTFTPKNASFKTKVSNLNVDFLRKLFADMDFVPENKGVEFAAPLITYLSSLKLQSESTDVLIETPVFKITADSTSTVVPMWALSVNPGESEGNLTLKGLAGIRSYLEQEEPRVASVIKSVLNTMEVLAKVKGETLHWNIQAPKALHPMMLINGQEFYIPSGVLNSSLMSLVYGMRGF